MQIQDLQIFYDPNQLFSQLTSVCPFAPFEGLLGVVKRKKEEETISSVFVVREEKERNVLLVDRSLFVLFSQLWCLSLELFGWGQLMSSSVGIGVFIVIISCFLQRSEHILQGVLAENCFPVAFERRGGQSFPSNFPFALRSTCDTHRHSPTKH